MSPIPGDMLLAVSIIPNKEMSGKSKQTTEKKQGKGNKANTAEVLNDDKVNIGY